MVIEVLRTPSMLSKQFTPLNLPGNTRRSPIQTGGVKREPKDGRDTGEGVEKTWHSPGLGIQREKGRGRLKETGRAYLA